eukprot:5525713-Pyramimonas_sp.AAC.1
MGVQWDPSLPLLEVRHPVDELAPAGDDVDGDEAATRRHLWGGRGGVGLFVQHSYEPHAEVVRGWAPQPPPYPLRTPCLLLGILDVHNVGNYSSGLLCPSRTVQHTLKMPL